MTRLSEHFSSQEFACKCGCGSDGIDPSMIVLLEWLRAEMGGRAVAVNSGVRCPAYNAQIGGAFNSQHLFGRAADVVVSGVSPDVVADFFDDCGVSDQIGLGRYDTFTHVDVRGTRARWDGR
jgi:uncharacterized protein YcbK (DUF882 family)